MFQCWDQCGLLAAMCVRYVSLRALLFQESRGEPRRLSFCLTAGPGSQEGDVSRRYLQLVLMVLG